MNPPETQILAWRVVGRVQGVGFRYWARQLAQRLELKGAVRNAPDGSVIVVAEGSVQALDQLERHLRSGPPGSTVRSLEAIQPPGSDLPFPFEIWR